MKMRASALEISLDGTLVGHLVSQQSGANVFAFADSYIALGAERPVLSLSFEGPTPEASAELLTAIYATNVRVPTFFSNLLPEGPLREYVAANLKIHKDDEFRILAALGSDLPGAVVATPVEQVSSRLSQDRKGRSIEIHKQAPLAFSLGGSQLKFSMFLSNDKFGFGAKGAEYIVKPPHPHFDDVPANEYHSMLLARAAGLNVPEVRLLPLENLDLENAPPLKFRTDERYAYAIKRFDRAPGNARIHIEDFAQVFGVYAHDEYTATNYDQMLRVLRLLPGGGDAVREMVGRLVVNALLGNGDAHLKNTSLIYRDGQTPTLAPLYDVLITQPYMRRRETAALNISRVKSFQKYDLDLFRRLAKRADLDEKSVLDAVRTTIDLAASTWPALIAESEMPESLRTSLEEHWKTLRSPFSSLSLKPRRRIPATAPKAKAR